MRRAGFLLLALTVTFATPALAELSPTLRGSRASMVRQNRIAKANDYSFLRTPSQVRRFVDAGILVPVKGGDDYEIARVSYPYARPEMRLFVERLSAQYRAGCGEKLVVTSLVRPTSEQPGNSHPLSVHPTGMAVDLRVSRSGECVRWLEGALLALEREELLDVTREYHPPHFHVALFTSRYEGHVRALLTDSVSRVLAENRQRLLAQVEASRRATPSLAAAPAPQPEPRPSREWLALAALPLMAFPLGVGLWRRRRRTDRSGTEDA